MSRPAWVYVRVLPQIERHPGEERGSEIDNPRHADAAFAHFGREKDRIAKLQWVFRRVVLHSTWCAARSLMLGFAQTQWVVLQYAVQKTQWLGSNCAQSRQHELLLSFASDHLTCSLAQGVAVVGWWRAAILAHNLFNQQRTGFAKWMSVGGHRCVVCASSRYLLLWSTRVRKMMIVRAQNIPNKIVGITTTHAHTQKRDIKHSRSTETKSFFRASIVVNRARKAPPQWAAVHVVLANQPTRSYHLPLPAQFLQPSQHMQPTKTLGTNSTHSC